MEKQSAIFAIVNDKVDSNTGNLDTRFVVFEKTMEGDIPSFNSCIVSTQILFTRIDDNYGRSNLLSPISYCPSLLLKQNLKDITKDDTESYDYYLEYIDQGGRSIKYSIMEYIKNKYETYQEVFDLLVSIGFIISHVRVNDCDIIQYMQTSSYSLRGFIDEQQSLDGNLSDICFLIYSYRDYIYDSNYPSFLKKIVFNLIDGKEKRLDHLRFENEDIKKQLHNNMINRTLYEYKNCIRYQTAYNQNILREVAPLLPQFIKE